VGPEAKVAARRVQVERRGDIVRARAVAAGEAAAGRIAEVAAATAAGAAVHRGAVRRPEEEEEGALETVVAALEEVAKAANPKAKVMIQRLSICRTSEHLAALHPRAFQP